jgi:hypothetical protein
MGVTIRVSSSTFLRQGELARLCLAHDSMGYYMPQTIRPPVLLAGLLPPRHRLRYDPLLMTYTQIGAAHHTDWHSTSAHCTLYIPNYLSSHFVYRTGFVGLSVRGESLVCSNSFSPLLECRQCAISLFRRIQNIKKHKTTLLLFNCLEPDLHCTRHNVSIT